MLIVVGPCTTPYDAGQAELEMSQNVFLRKVATHYFQMKRHTMHSGIYDIILAEQIGESMYEYVANHAFAGLSNFASFFVHELVDATLD